MTGHKYGKQLWRLKAGYLDLCNTTAAALPSMPRQERRPAKQLVSEETQRESQTWSFPSDDFVAFFIQLIFRLHVSFCLGGNSWKRICEWLVHWLTIKLCFFLRNTSSPRWMCQLASQQACSEIHFTTRCYIM